MTHIKKSNTFEFLLNLANEFQSIIYVHTDFLGTYFVHAYEQSLCIKIKDICMYVHIWFELHLDIYLVGSIHIINPHYEDINTYTFISTYWNTLMLRVYMI